MSGPQIEKMISNDFATTHWASPGRNSHKETEPNILAEEVVFSVDESIEFRVFGRHGWHVGKVVKREMVADGTAMSYVYTVESLSASFGYLGEIEGLKAGNIRRPSDYAAHFSLAMSAPPMVEDYSTATIKMDIDKPMSPLVGSTKHIGTAKVNQSTTHLVEKAKTIRSNILTKQGTQLTTAANETQAQESTRKQEDLHQGGVDGTDSEVGEESDGLKTTVSTKSSRDDGEEEEGGNCHQNGVLPAAVSSLLRYGKTRGINTVMWFTPPQGFGDQAENENQAATVTTNTQPKLVDGSFFIEKLTHLGLGLAVGRPLKEQLLIEEALSSHNLEEAVKVATSICANGGTGFKTSSRLGTGQQATTRMDDLSVVSSSSSQAVGLVDIDWLVTTLGLNYDEDQSSSSPSSKSDGHLEQGGRTERVETQGFNKHLFSNQGERDQNSQHQTNRSKLALKTYQSAEKKEKPTWESVKLCIEKKLKLMCRFHKDKFYKLRASLKLIDPTSVRIKHSLSHGGSFQASSVFSDVSRVGAAAAAVFKEKSLIDQSASCEASESLADSLRGESMSGGGGGGDYTEDMVQLEEKVMQHGQSADVVTLAELKKAFRVNEFNGWQLVEVEALIRTVSGTKEEEATPRTVDRTALKEYLMSTMLERKVGWDKWAASKTREHHLFKSTLIDGFSELLSGETGEYSPTDSEVSSLLELVAKIEQAPDTLNVFQTEVYQTLLQAEATHLAEMWLTSSEARQKVRDKMVNALETRRLENTASTGGGGDKEAVTLFELYQRHVTRWYKLKRLHEEGSEGGGDEGEEAVVAVGGGSSHSNRTKPPSFNEWVDRYADPSGHVRRSSVESVLVSKAEEYLLSESSPALELNCNEIPKHWKGMGEIERFTDEQGRKMVKFKPLTLTKQLLKQFLLDKEPKTGFYDWLESREKHREDTKSRVGEWSRRKDKVRALISAKASCCAVLSLDAGGIESASLGHTIDGLVKSMVPFSETTEGGPEGGVGAFGVRKPSRKGLNIDNRLRRVASKGVEVKPKPPDQSANQLKAMLQQVMSDYVKQSDQSRMIHVDRVRIPSESSGFSDLRFRGNDFDTSHSQSEPKTIHSAKVYNYLYRQSDRRGCGVPSHNDMIVEVKVVASGKWHKAQVLSHSESKASVSTTSVESGEGQENQPPKSEVKVKAKKRRSSVTAKPATPKHPCYYTVRLLKSAQEQRVNEEVDIILQKCSQQGEKCCEVLDESTGQVRVSYEQLEPSEALEKQRILLEELCAKVGWTGDVEGLKEMPWVGPLALPGTAQMPKHRTHAYVVSKKSLDEELEPCLTSLLADRTASHLAKQLIDTFDYGFNRKTVNQERKLGLISSGSLDTAAARASVQQNLMESTNGMFHVEEERQIEMAQELAEGRDRQADIAFREWARAKEIQKRKEAALLKKAEKEKENKLKEKEKQNKIAYKEWSTARKKKKYFGSKSSTDTKDTISAATRPNGNKSLKDKPPKEKEIKDWPVRNKPLIQKPWSFAPPVYEEEFI